MPATAMMTLRIDPELLAALKRRATKEGRSVSAEVVRMIRRELEAEPMSLPEARRTMGMFAGFEAPELEAFRAVRRAASASVVAAAHANERAASVPARGAKKR